MTMVYLIQAGGPAQPVKIGVTWADPRQTGRLSTLQSMTYLPLEVIRVVPGGCKVVESWFHHRYARLHIRGEWFNFDPEMLTVEVPPRARAVTSLRALTRGILDYQIGQGIGRPHGTIARWVRRGGAPASDAVAIAKFAATKGFDIDPRVLMPSEAA